MFGGQSVLMIGDLITALLQYCDSKSSSVSNCGVMIMPMTTSDNVDDDNVHDDVHYRVGQIK